MSELIWKTSTKCDTGSCVEVAWRKSSRSMNNATCVEVQHETERVLVRDSKNPDGGVIEYTPQQWRHLLHAVKFGGTLDDVVSRTVDVVELGNGEFCWDPPGGPWSTQVGCLHFTRDEMDAFVAGVRAGEFDVPERTNPDPPCPPHPPVPPEPLGAPR